MKNQTIHGPNEALLVKVKRRELYFVLPRHWNLQAENESQNDSPVEGTRRRGRPMTKADNMK